MNDVDAALLRAQRIVPRRPAIALAVGGLAILAACATPEDGFVEMGDAERGLAFVEARCSSCHAVGRTGESPYAPAPPLRTLHMKYDVEGLAEAFAEGILVSHRGEKQMPEFVLTPEEIDDLIVYLKSFQ